MTAKPCPWCGGVDVEFQVMDCKDREGVPVHMVCAECGASGPWEYVVDDKNYETVALANWNKKPDLPSANITDILLSNKSLDEKVEKINEHYRLLYGRHDFSDYKQLTESLLIQFIGDADTRQLNCVESVLATKIDRNTKLLEKVKDRKRHDLKKAIGEV